MCSAEWAAEGLPEIDRRHSAPCNNSEATKGAVAESLKRLARGFAVTFAAGSGSHMVPRVSACQQPTLERRLRTSIETLLKVAEWNVRVIHALEQAWLEEREKRAQLEQEKRR